MSKIYKVTEPQSNISMAATIIEPLQRITDLQKIRVSNIYVGIDPNLNLINLSGEVIGQLRQLLTEHQLSVIPVLSIEDSAAIKPLATLLNDKNSFDITLISTQPDLIKQARELMPLIRGAVDYSHYDFSAVKNPLIFIVRQTNRAKVKIALLPVQFSSKKEVETLQKRLLTVWSIDYGACLSSAVAILTTGVNGIISHNTAQMIQAMSLFEQPSLVRKPFIIGHRGIPSLLPENTLEGLIKAYQLGVDAVEYDIQLSIDKQIVLIHDDNVKRTTNGVGLIQEMSLADVKRLRIMNKETITEFSVPTLDQVFAQFADTQLIHFIEIKSHKKEIVRELKVAIDKYHLSEQVIVISFIKAQIIEMHKMLPEISLGFLSDFKRAHKIEKTLQNILAATQSLSSTFNPSYENLTVAIMAAAKHRGTTFWTWTYKNQKKAYYYYLQGTHGLTTDYPQWFTDLPVYLLPESTSKTIKVEQPLTIAIQIVTQRGQQFTAQPIYTLIETDASYRNTGGTLIFTTAGQASVLLSHLHKISEGHCYYLYSAPIRITLV